MQDLTPFSRHFANMLTHYYIDQESITQEAVTMNPHVISVLDVGMDERDYNPEDMQFKYRLLAEGDSWFTLRGFPTSNVLVHLDFPDKAIVVNCGKHGDTMRRMGKMSIDKQFKKMLGKRYGHPWCAILFSGGGNDLIEDASKIIKPAARRGSPDPADYCDQSQLETTMSDIVQGYENVVAVRDGPRSGNVGVPIITHTYDYPTPRNSPARFIGFPITGPWLYKALVGHRIPEPMWLPITDYLIDRLAETLMGLQKSLPNFHVVDTRRTLKRVELGVTLFTEDWADEIHPSARGYAKIAKKLSRETLRQCDQPPV